MTFFVKVVLSKKIIFQFIFVEACDNEARAGLQAAGGVNSDIVYTLKLL